MFLGLCNMFKLLSRGRSRDIATVDKDVSFFCNAIKYSAVYLLVFFYNINY